MKEPLKTKKQLIREVRLLRTRINRLKDLEKKYNQTRETLQNSTKELDQTSLGLEKTLERSNYMAIEAELTYLELNQMFNAAGDGMWIINKKKEVLRINEALAKILSIDINDISGKKCSDLLDHKMCGTTDCLLKQIKKGRDQVDMDIELDNTDGTKSYFSLTANPFKGLADELIGIVVNFKDITQRKLAEEELQKLNTRLEQLAALDGLTRIANRRSFDEHLERELKRLKRSQAPISLILCDIDFFKLYNDRYGHQMGDSCLQSVAKAFAGGMQRPADLAARYGGEEFVAILPETDEAGAVSVAEKIQKTLQELNLKHEASKVCDHVTLSIGIASIIPTRETTPEEIIKASDDALYLSKENGRNCITVSGK